jgi:hypothetical protein
MTLKSKRYLEKIKNNIDEGLYDLLIVHLMQIGKSIKLYGDDAKAMIELLDKAIKKLKSKINDKNRLFYFRYILLCANKILLLDKNRLDIKKLKIDIINQYKQKEAISTDDFPLHEQLTEVRITYDVSYLIHLARKLIEQQDLIKAFYIFEAIRLIEPDNDLIDEFQDFFNSRFPIVKPKLSRVFDISNTLCVLDANVLIPRLLEPVQNFSFWVDKAGDLSKLGNKVKRFIALPITMEELREAVEAKIIWARPIIEKNKKFNLQEIKSTLNKRLEKIKSKYYYDIKYSDEIIKEVKEFYLERIGLLRFILNEKLGNEKTLSHKLRRLSRRINFLPEHGDIQLLVEAIALSRTTHEEIALLSKDSDFQYFADDIFNKWGIKVFWDFDE